MNSGFKTVTAFLVLALALGLALAPAAATDLENIDTIFPITDEPINISGELLVQEDSNFTGNDLQDVGELQLDEGLRLTGTEIRDPGNVNVLSYNTATNQWEVRSSELNLTDSQIVQLQDPTDPQDAATKFYVDEQIDTEQQNLSEVLEQGRIANQSINMSDNALENVGSLYSDGSSTSFFSGGGSQTQTVTGISSDGTLQTTSILIDSDSIQFSSINGSHIIDGEVGSSELASEAVTNATLDSSDSFSINQLDITGDLTGTGIVDSDQIFSQAVGSSELDTGVAGTGLSGGDGESLAVVTTELDGDAIDGDQNQFDVVPGNIDAGDLSGESGVDGYFLRTDGTDANWVELDMPDDQNLSEVLEEGNIANQSIDMDGNTILNVGDLDGTDIVNETAIEAGSVGDSELDSNEMFNIQAIDLTTALEAGNLSIGDGLQDDGGEVAVTQACSSNQVLEYTDGSWSCTDIDDLQAGDQDLESVLGTGHTAGPHNISMDGEDILEIGNLEGTAIINNENIALESVNRTQIAQSGCGDEQTLQYNTGTGEWECVDSDSLGTDDTENLSETLTAGNIANQTINMDGNSIENIGQLQGSSIVNLDNLGSQVFNEFVETDGDTMQGNLEMDGNEILETSRLTMEDGLILDSNDITGTNRIRFNEGVTIGDSSTETGNPDTIRENKTVNTENEWNNNESSSNETVLTGGKLRLNTSEDTEAVADFIEDKGNEVEDVAAAEAYDDAYYVVYDDDVHKYDFSGGEPNHVWTWSSSQGSVVDIDVIDDKIHMRGGFNSFIGKIIDDGDSVTEVFDKDTNTRDNDITADENGNTYQGITTHDDGGVKKFDSDGNELWRYDAFPNEGDTYVAYQEGYIFAAEYWSEELHKIDVSCMDSDPADETDCQEWIYDEQGNSIEGVDVHQDHVYIGGSYGGFRGVERIDVETGERDWRNTDISVQTFGSISVSDQGVYIGKEDWDDEHLVTKFERLSGDKQWEYSQHTDSIYRVDATDDGYVFTGSPDNTARRLEDITLYKENGYYLSNGFSAGSIDDWPSAEFNSQIPDNTQIEAELQFDNSSTFDSPETEDLGTVESGIDTRSLDVEAEFARFNLTLDTSDTEQTPEVDQVTLTYGATAAELGLEQTAIGGNASTEALGAVAIGEDSQSNQEDTAVFGSEERPYDLEVTGDLHVDGETTGINVETDTENLSETLTAGNVANQTIDMDGNDISNAETVETESVASTGRMCIGDRCT